jgi:hypothetical protein
MAGVEAGVMLPYTKNPAVANLPAAYPSPSFPALEGLEAQRARRPSRSSPSRFDAMPCEPHPTKKRGRPSPCENERFFGRCGRIVPRSWTIVLAFEIRSEAIQKVNGPTEPIPLAASVQSRIPPKPTAERAILTFKQDDNIVAAAGRRMDEQSLACAVRSIRPSVPLDHRAILKRRQDSAHRRRKRGSGRHAVVRA